MHAVLLLAAWFSLACAATALGVAIWSLNWPRVKGTVTRSIYEPGDEAGEEGDRLHLEYSYIVAGVAYTGHRVSPLAGVTRLHPGMGDTPASEGTANWSSARVNSRWYREGVTVDVYYCPRRPSWACLEPGGFLVAGVFAIVAAIFFGLG